MQHTITGWPGGKPNADDTYRPERATPFPKKVIVFSPHPDDDVISMGGTIRRLVQQNHDVHVAYETSGNIAVGDEEVTRFMHFINGFNQLFADSKDSIISNKYKEIKTFFAKKKESDFDTRDILTIKGLIRRGEARTACTYNEIPLDHVHFLDLPFYESGKIEKLPMTEKDVEIVRALLQKVQPHQIYVAGDLADPHGTHKKCTDAVLAAIDEEKKAGAEWLKDCRIWMYRGAWAEWEIENIEMCVPLSLRSCGQNVTLFSSISRRWRVLLSWVMMSACSGREPKTVTVLLHRSTTSWVWHAMRPWRLSWSTNHCNTLLIYLNHGKVQSFIRLVCSLCGDAGWYLYSGICCRY